MGRWSLKALSLVTVPASLGFLNVLVVFTSSSSEFVDLWYRMFQAETQRKSFNRCFVLFISSIVLFCVWFFFSVTLAQGQENINRWYSLDKDNFSNNKGPASLVRDNFLYSCDLNIWFCIDTVWRNYMRITSKGKRVNSIDFHGLIFRIVQDVKWE